MTSHQFLRIHPSAAERARPPLAQEHRRAHDHGADHGEREAARRHLIGGEGRGMMEERERDERGADGDGGEPDGEDDSREEADVGRGLEAEAVAHVQGLGAVGERGGFAGGLFVGGVHDSC
ncbi:hypothetical protein XANCAGTX0491_005392 [Xanthoria calcicola]